MRAILRVGAVTLLACFVLACGRTTAKDTRPLPFDLALGKNIGAIRADIQQRFGSDEGLESTGDSAGHASVMYVLDLPEGGSAVMVGYDYRLADGVIWGIDVAHAQNRFDGSVGGVPLDASVDSIRSQLGKPFAQREHAPVIDSIWWQSPALGYRVHVYSSEYGWAKAGDIDSIHVWRRDVAPAGYDAGASAADQ